MIHASGIVISSVSDKLLEPPDVVQQRYNLSYPPLVPCQTKLLGQILHLLTGPPTVLFFQFYIGIDELIIAVKAADIIIEPNPEFL